MKNLFVIIFAVCCLAGCNDSGNNQIQNYYINALNGNDDNSGKSEKEAWRSLQNISKHDIRPGDSIILISGAIFKESLIIKDLNGTAEKPVVITSKGDSSAAIHSGDSLAILATNCSYLKIENIKTLGSGRLKGNKTNGIELFKCRNSQLDRLSASGYLYTGIKVTGGNNIRITGCYASDNGFCGIFADSGEKEYGKDGSAYKTMRNLYISNCVADNNPGCPVIKDNHSGNGILVAGVINGLIEHCEAMNNGWDMPREGNGPVGIWAYMCDSIIIQHCYAHHNKTSPKGKDGGGFDFDGGIRYSVFQYNLSAFNEGAGYGIFQYAGATEWTDNIARYNISYNDGSKNSNAGIFVWCDPAAEKMKNFSAYNNTIINSFGHGVSFDPNFYENFKFENNIYLVSVQTDNFIGGDNYSGQEFENNLYWCEPLSAEAVKRLVNKLDKKAVVGDPKLVNHPEGSSLLNNPFKPELLGFFTIQKGSAATGAGKITGDNAVMDFWKNPIDNNGTLNIGAWQGK
ncbi:MAG: right-handed parallel beta-helix repeat-containing protein [Bacteroidales bacterium]